MIQIDARTLYIVFAMGVILGMMIGGAVTTWWLGLHGWRPRRSPVRQEGSPHLTALEKEWIYQHNSCPDCRGTLQVYAKGGLGMNSCCELCGARFAYARIEGTGLLGARRLGRG